MSVCFKNICINKINVYAEQTNSMNAIYRGYFEMEAIFRSNSANQFFLIN